MEILYKGRSVLFDLVLTRKNCWLENAIFVNYSRRESVIWTAIYKICKVETAEIAISGNSIDREDKL